MRRPRAAPASPAAAFSSARPLIRKGLQEARGHPADDVFLHIWVGALLGRRIAPHVISLRNWRPYRPATRVQFPSLRATGQRAIRARPESHLRAQFGQPAAPPIGIELQLCDLIAR